MQYLLVAIFAGLLSAGLTPLVKKYAWNHGVLDDPSIDKARRQHDRPVALLGGLAVGLVVVFGLLLLPWLSANLSPRYIPTTHFLVVLGGVLLLMLGGILDDRLRLSPRQSILFPVLASLLIVLGGIGVNFITRPWGGVWRIDTFKITLFVVDGWPYVLSLGSALFTFIWLMGMMYTTKLLDGLDGLVSGITVIGATILLVLCLRPPVLQPDTALLAALVAGAFAGFLPWNFSPAKIFLGEGGALLAGFLLGILGIIAGGKIAATLLIIGIPVLDVVWVILRRLFWERKSVAAADRKHLHFRLLDAGLTTRQAVLLLWGMSIGFGAIGLFLHSWGKLIALLLLAFFGILLAAFVVRRQRRANLQMYAS